MGHLPACGRLTPLIFPRNDWLHLHLQAMARAFLREGLVGKVWVRASAVDTPPQMQETELTSVLRDA